MSNASGSRLFAGDNKGIIRILTISLSLFATISAALFAYQLYTKPAVPDLISKDEAIQAALKAGKWNELTLRDKKIDATLVYVKENGFSFIVNEKTLQDTITLYHNQYPSYENYHLWIVSITATNNMDWVYTINAATGESVTAP